MTVDEMVGWYHRLDAHKAIRALATERLPCEDGGHTERIRPQGHPPAARQLPSTMSGS